MDTDDLKPFDPTDVDETLTRVVVHGGKTHLLFPYVDGVGAEPQYHSIGVVIAGPAATIRDFQELTVRVKKKAGEAAVWRIVFNTPWLVAAADDIQVAERTRRS
jgi:hypothetical protein